MPKKSERPKSPRALALGSLLGFYRRRRQDIPSQSELSAQAGLHSGEVALYESGQRVPAEEALAKIARALDLSAFQSKELSVIAGHGGGEVAKHEWLVPEDVLHGTPIFLRSPESESDLQQQADISQLWIVSVRPMALKGPMYDFLRKRLVQGDTRFVFFVGRELGEQSYQTLWRTLWSGSPSNLRGALREKLKFVLAPEAFFIAHYAIANPGEVERMFGRVVIHRNGLPVGFYPMDSVQMNRAYGLLDQAYQECVMHRGDDVHLKQLGTFKMLVPDIPPTQTPHSAPPARKKHSAK